MAGACSTPSGDETIIPHCDTDSLVNIAHIPKQLLEDYGAITSNP